MKDKFHILQVFGEKEAKDLVIRATNKLRKSLGDDKPLSKKGALLREKCLSAPPAYGKLLSELLSIFMEEEISIENLIKDTPFVLWAAVVPISNNNSHNYEMGSVILMQINDKGGNLKAIRNDGLLGNHIQLKQSSIRPANDKEIDKFISNLYEMIDDDC